MPDLIDTIKAISKNTYESMSPPKMTVGRINTLDPLEIKVDEKLYLKTAQLILLESAGELSEGDRVIMLRVQKGQNYIILGRAK